VPHITRKAKLEPELDSVISFRMTADRKLDTEEINSRSIDQEIAVYGI
jgi:hypothetical protein